MKIFKILTALIILLGFSGCSSLSVNYDYNQQTDFTKYKTYDWLPFPKDLDASELSRARFITAVENNLAEKGFTQNSSKPGLVIATHYGKESKVDITNWGYSYAPNSYYAGYGYRHPGRYGYAGGYATTGGVSVYEYEQGTLILDFVDANSKQLIWRATAKGIISPASTPEKQTKKVNNAVKKILESFPPEKQNANQEKATTGAAY